MPDLPLYSSPPDPDAGHRVIAPGGYEWWYVDAEDATTDTQVVAILLDGFVFHPQYRRRFKQFARRPTKNSPPLAADYPCAYMVIYQNGKIAAQFMSQFPPGSFAASDTEPKAAVGPNTFERQPDGSLLWTLSGTPWEIGSRGPRTLIGETLGGTLRLQPTLTAPPVQREFLSRAMTGADHQWVIANPHCTFTAELSQTGAPATKAWSLSGRAYHDHNFGTGPLGPGLARWVWGRLLLQDCVYTFHHAVPRDRSLPAETHLLRGEGATLESIAVDKVEADWSAQTALLLTHPRRIAFDNRLILTNPRMIDLAPFYMRLQYDAVTPEGGGKAFCEVAYPHRLLWPVLGRMIEMSIHKQPSV